VIIFELTRQEGHPAYQALEVSNGNRQYSFLLSIIEAALALGRPFLSQTIIKALNFHAITCLHTNAGEYRPCPVIVGQYEPPQHYQVPALMDDFVNTVNRIWDTADPIELSAYVLWRMNHIHPFINGNGRTARAACYFVLCVKSGGLLPGKVILPQLIRRDRDDYIKALHAVDASHNAGSLQLGPLGDFLAERIDEQIASSESTDDAPSDKA
jgi:Fic family protein